MKIEIGKVIKAHGIKGEIKLACFVDDPSMLNSVKQLYIGTKTYSVAKIRSDGVFCYILLQGIEDRNTAESLRNWVVYADKENLLLPNDRFFIADLINCSVITDEDVTVGVITEVLQYGAADVFVCKQNGKEVRFPFLKDLVLNVNINGKAITVDAKRLAEVAVYED